MLRHGSDSHAETWKQIGAMEMPGESGCWFDLGDDRWHQINVEGIEATVPSGRSPKVTRRGGRGPPQYVDEDV